MPLAKRIIPCLDVNHGKVVKGIHFRNLRDAGDPASLAKRYCDEGADELVFLDITASPEKRKILEKMVKEVAMVLDIPFTVGGGISSLEDARLVLQNGADKVSVNTAAVNDPDLVTRLSDKFGGQCVVVAVDAKRRFDSLKDRITVEEDGSNFWFEVHTYGGSRPTGLDAVAWAKQAEKMGAGEILLTSIDKDGTESGYDLSLTRLVSENVSIPVIASGGCGTAEHILEVFQKGGADAALAASIFHYGTYSVTDVKQYLRSRKVTVRL
ncbi:MAG: imidazole glycerol phosphate synthase subunit HisF [Thaumarchaeota archaeon]|nr:imidazole glycerol phosphate synthase subunit HisF [Nitrososphaerota archaeon]MCL5317820.1 imidazole glycerol phosphate synthase subunit HisF [Nitrososphaerota archaeon]